MFSLFHNPSTPPSLGDFSPFHTHDATRWPTHQTTQLSTRCNGRLLEGWHHKLIEHFGEDAIEIVREDAQGDLDLLPLHIDKHARYPLAWVLRLVEVVADRWMDGELDGFQEFAIDALKGSPSHRASLLRGALRAMPLSLILRKATSLYQRAYDQGCMRMLQHKHAATLQFEGSAHHDHPTWQALQVLGIETLLKLTCGKRFSIASQHPAPGAFHLYLEWR
ncbi:MAG: hypothetical protein H6728_04800 [Myxococcales bacterium]|nr:hypothetical protein [Myxococcales bacterium]MCB9642371.1 hypothetical protein [Myxococcales bacterium]